MARGRKPKRTLRVRAANSKEALDTAPEFDSGVIDLTTPPAVRGFLRPGERVFFTVADARTGRIIDGGFGTLRRGGRSGDTLTPEPKRPARRKRK